MSKKSIKIGDIFRLGDHRLICGDATKTEHVKSLLQQDQIKLILTDVPYGVAMVEGKQDFRTGKKHQPILNDHLQSDEEFRTFTINWLQPIIDQMTNKNSFYIFNSDKMIFPMRTALLEQGFKLSQLLVWAKTGAVIGRLDYLPQHELIAYGWRGKHEFLKSKDKSILISPKTKKNTLHPTMKPISILRQLILNSTRTKDIVYDPFGGSGSTLIACEQTKRQCRMIEISPHYCQVIIDRWEKICGKKAVHLNPSDQ